MTGVARHGARKAPQTATAAIDGEEEHMPNRAYNPEDFWTGVLFLCISAFFIWGGYGLESGTMARIGPGFFPHWIAVGLGMLGLYLLVKGLATRGGSLGPWGVRGIVMVTGSLVLFGLSMSYGMGLVVSGIATMAAAALAAPHVRWIPMLAVAAVVVACSAVLFVTLLGLPFPLWPELR